MVVSARANRQLNAWRKQQEPSALPIVQNSAREQICRALMEATVNQVSPDQGQLW